MYFSRTGNLIDLLVWLLMSLCWCAGGWLLIRSIFHLRQRERLISGAALGLILFIVFSNLLGQVLDLTGAYWGAALTVLVVGVYATRYQRGTSALNYHEEFLPALFQMAAFIGLFLIYSLINRGLAIFDDYFNLPLVSRIAVGDVPPHYFLYPEKMMPLHYGLHLFAASLVRIASLFPWSAFDLSKAFSQALTVVLAWLWIRRQTRSRLGAFLGALLVLFGSGARWLLLLLPKSLLIQGSMGIQLLGSGAQSGPNLVTALGNPWNISGGGPTPFPFAFVNGLFPPITLALTSTGAMPLTTVFLLLLLVSRRMDFKRATVTGIILASLALTAEHVFALIWLGIAMALLVRWRCLRQLKSEIDHKNFIYWIWQLTLAAAVAIPAGGVITVIARRYAAWLSGGAMESGFGLYGFSLRWPPAIVSAHLGTLSFFNPFQVLVILFEMGPIFWLAPVVTFYFLKKAHRESILKSGIALAAIFAFLASCFVVYQEREREIARMTDLALSLWMVLGYPVLWWIFKNGKRIWQILIGLGYLIVLVSGLVIFIVEMIAAKTPQLSDFITRPDALLSQQYWNKLPEDSQILDRLPFRAVTLFGRTAGKAYIDNYTPTPEWLELITNFDPVKAAQMDYQYVYFDKAWRIRLSGDGKKALENSCIKKIAKIGEEKGEFRSLLDIGGCRMDKTSP